MKIAIVGDVHLGKAQKGSAERENDIYDLFSRICNRMVDEKVNIVCFLGDLFDSSHPPVRAIFTALSEFENLAKNNIKVILIAGNHDLPSIKTRMCPLELSKFNENMDNNIIELSSQNPIFKFNENNTNINICGVEYHPPEKRQSLIKTLENISSHILLNSSEKNLNILLLHQGVREFSPTEEEISLTEIPNIFDYIFVGHLHLRRERLHGKAKVYMPGSIEIGSVSEVIEQMHSEANVANIILIDTEERRINKIKIPLSRKFIHKKFRSSAIDDELKRLADELEKSIINGKLPWVYLEVEDDAKIGNSLINEKIARATEGRVMFVQKEINSEETKEKINAEISFKGINIKEIIKTYFPKYGDEIYELYEKRKDINNAKGVMRKIYEIFREDYKRQRLA